MAAPKERCEVCGETGGLHTDACKLRRSVRRLVKDWRTGSGELKPEAPK
ncbi:hypothetical protein LCGC14_1200490 [marine sediment metagenome]|uniref:Uncharacterized protein n=1 Tax=marine sediment metagenome TaxID=412755 RepID=A0A0F9NZG6_9ZZZZ